MSQGNDYSKGFIIGALVGGVAGAITALLLAPKSGAELRKDIKTTSTDLYSKVSGYISQIEGEVGQSVSGTINESKDRANRIMNAARSKAEEILHDAENVLSDARNKAVSAKENVQAKIENVRDAAKAGADAFKSEYNSTES